MNHYDEMVDIVLPWVARVNRAITWPVLKKKTGMEVISAGKNFGEIQTNLDIGVSTALLDGSPELDIAGLRSMYPGSFSEEQDSPERTKTLVIYEVDPIDGTGDLKKTYQSENVMSPTTLVTKLERKSVDEPFTPVAGMIFEILNEYALVSDGKELGLYAVTGGLVKKIPFEFGDKEEEWTGFPATGSSVAFVNHRDAYLQKNFDIAFAEFMSETRRWMKQVKTGGAGMQALQCFRTYIHPTETGAEVFAKLEPLNIIFNCQPDWKTWDTDPSRVIAKAIGNRNYAMWKARGFDVESYRWPRLEVDIFGHPLTANAAAPSLKDMWHRSGCVMATYRALESCMLQAAEDFTKKTGKSLLEINY